MVFGRLLTAKSYGATNALLAVLFANLAIFGPRLQMGKAFTLGVGTGVLAGWLLFAVLGRRALKDGGRALDERIASIYAKAGSLAFWTVAFAGAVLQLLLRSEALRIGLDAPGAVALLCNLGFVAFGASAFVIGRKS